MFAAFATRGKIRAHVAVMWTASHPLAVTKGGCMSEQEQERNAPETDDPDVEGHRTKAQNDEGSEGQEADRRATDDESDVEGHRFKA
jgi:hypothetical protein